MFSNQLSSDKFLSGYLEYRIKTFWESLAAILENLWRTDELLKELKRTDVMFIFKSREQKKSDNYILFCLSS